VLAARPVSTRTKREAVCQLAQNWHTESRFVRTDFSARIGDRTGLDRVWRGTPGSGEAAADAPTCATATRRLPASLSAGSATSCTRRKTGAER
jgi:hypothetical protein